MFVILTCNVCQLAKSQRHAVLEHKSQSNENIFMFVY